MAETIPYVAQVDDGDVEDTPAAAVVRGVPEVTTTWGSRRKVLLAVGLVVLATAAVCLVGALTLTNNQHSEGGEVDSPKITGGVSDWPDRAFGRDTRFENDRRYYSANGAVFLVCQSDGNLVLYRQSDGVALFHTNTWGVVQIGCWFNNDGQLTAGGVFPFPRFFVEPPRLFWDPKNDRIVIQNDGNLVIYRGNSAMWHSHTHGQAHGPPFGSAAYAINVCRARGEGIPRIPRSANLEDYPDLPWGEYWVDTLDGGFAVIRDRTWTNATYAGGFSCGDLATPSNSPSVSPSASPSPDTLSRTPSVSLSRTPSVSPSQSPSPVHVDAQVAAGLDHAMQLSSSGTLYLWGDNQYGQVLGSNGSRLAPYDVTPDLASTGAGILTKIGAGTYHSFAIDFSFKVFAWGRNHFSQLGLGDGLSHTIATPTEVPELSSLNLVDIGGGENFSYGLDGSGVVFTWGKGQYGELGQGSSSAASFQSIPTPISVLGGVVIEEVSAGQHSMIARAIDGTVYSWGQNNRGQLGDGSTTDRSMPVQITLDEIHSPIQVQAGDSFHLILSDQGTVFYSGAYYNSGNPTSISDLLTPTEVPSLSETRRVTNIWAGPGVAFAQTNDGGLWGWGNDGLCAIGPNAPWQGGPNQLAPQRIFSGRFSFDQLAGSYNGVVAITSNERAMAWGSVLFHGFGLHYNHGVCPSQFIQIPERW